MTDRFHTVFCFEDLRGLRIWRVIGEGGMETQTEREVVELVPNGFAIASFEEIMGVLPGGGEFFAMFSHRC